MLYKVFSQVWHVSCWWCNCTGFFHKKHVTKSTGSITSKCTYTCRKCQDGACIKVIKKKGRPKLQKGNTSFKGKSSVYSKSSVSAVEGKKLKQSTSGKKNSVIPLRRSTRKVKLISRQSETVGGLNKRKQIIFKKGKRPKKPKYPKKSKKAKITQKQKFTVQGVWQKKRTAVCFPYWLNGLRLSRKPNDERIMQFRREKLILAFEQTNAVLDRPQCSLCRETEFTSTLNYVCCELCRGKLEVWVVSSVKSIIYINAPLSGYQILICYVVCLTFFWLLKYILCDLHILQSGFMGMLLALLLKELEYSLDLGATVAEVRLLQFAPICLS